MHNTSSKLTRPSRSNKYFIMKMIWCFYGTLICSVCYSQSPVDTLQIDREANQIIFVANPNSKFHDNVFKLLLADFGQPTICGKDTNMLDNSKSKYLGDWITVKKFRGKYYAYSPSEPFYNTFIRLTDSLLVMNDFNEGFVSFRYRNKIHTETRAVLQIVENNSITNLLTIRKKSKGIFVVRSSLFNSKRLFFVRRETFCDYPIIVNNCPSNRCPEFRF